MRTANHRCRPAFTMLELLFVLAIVIIVAGLGLPAMQALFVDARITAAGDVLRGRLADARAAAMEKGRPWRLAYLPGTGVVQLAPEDGDWDDVSKDETEQPDLIRQKLPKDIVLAVNESDISGSGGPGAEGSKWETIAVYLGDGSARDDTTVYYGKAGLLPMRIRVRGLTGTVTLEAPTLKDGTP